ncbi:MAG: polyprenyl synthetase family protein [Bacillota bacterium]|nr:polyprenyl synthetase family protein [Bacillota bacterium]
MNYRGILREIASDLAYVETELEKHALTSNTLLRDTSDHLLKAGGKRLRPALVLLAGKFFNYLLERLGPLAVAIELIHMATLVHDDIIDGASTRRGIPTVRAQWGDPVALYTGSYLLAQALTLVAEHGNAQVARVLADVSLKMCEGEIEQIETIGKLDQGMRAYLRRIKLKTALLISSCCLIGALASDAPPAVARSLKKYGYYIGMAFQISDDILDLVGSEKQCGKPVGSDLRQGIITLPVIYALKDRTWGSRLAQIILTENKEESEWEEIFWLVKVSGALNSSQNLCNLYLAKAKQQLMVLPDLPPRRILAAMADFVGSRDF